MNKLFTIDPRTRDVIVSESAIDSTAIILIERIPRNENELLYQAVKTLSLITKSSPIDLKLFNSMDKVCQLIYN